MRIVPAKFVDPNVNEQEIWELTKEQWLKQGWALKDQRRADCIKHYRDIQDEDNATYPDNTELLSIGSPFAKRLGLTKLGIHHELLPPGRRTSWPHAESDEDEFAYVIEGQPDVWIDGELYSLNPGDGVGFPSGTGISHTFINNSKNDVRLLVVGEATKKSNKVYYPLNPERRVQMPDGCWWDDVPSRPLGAHPGKPNLQQREEEFK